MYLQLGNIKFEGLLGFSSLSDTIEATYAQHELIGRKPRLQRTGNTLREFTGAIKLHSSFCIPEEQYGKLEFARQTGESLPFIYGNGNYQGDFVIKSISRVPEQTDPNGNVISMTCNIVLTETDSVGVIIKRIEQDKADAFARSSNGPLSAGSDVKNVNNPALSVMNENKGAQQGAAKVGDATDAVKNVVDSTPDPGETLIPKAQAFLDASPTYTAKINKQLNNITKTLDGLTTLIGANPVISSVSPTLSAAVTDAKALLIVVQTVISDIAGLPSPVNTTGDALTVLNMQKDSITKVADLLSQIKVVNSASSGVASVVATKVSVSNA